jgi:ADP-heptose:LPS heptosyltransferase
VSLSIAQKKRMDWAIGTFALLALRPLARLMGRFMRRDHASPVRGSLCICKLLGGGNFFMLLPALLGLRKRYPDARFIALTTRSIAPFAEAMHLFDEIVKIDDRSVLKLIRTTFSAWARTFRTDTVVDLEVTSRLSTVFSCLTCARNRISYYIEDVRIRQNICTHLIFFNRSASRPYFYDQIAWILDAEPADMNQCRSYLQSTLNAQPIASDFRRTISIGHGCSDLATERRLSPSQWAAYIARRAKESPLHLHFLGSKADREPAEEIIGLVGKSGNDVQISNDCGTTSLHDSLTLLSRSSEFWGIDSGLLHAARILGLRCVSFWGPTDPETRLVPIPGLDEEIHYLRIACSPCVHVTEIPPCRGNNLCMKGLLDPSAAPSSESVRTNLVWWPNEHEK